MAATAVIFYVTLRYYFESLLLSRNVIKAPFWIFWQYGGYTRHF